MRTPNQYDIAVEQIAHPAVRRVMRLNVWKIRSWQEYALWKRRARKWVAIEWREKLQDREVIADD